MKRILSMLLALSMLFGMLPVVTQAEEVPQAALDNRDVTLEGTNSFGNLLSQEIVQEQATDAEAAQDYPDGYTVLDLTVDGNVAIVEYDTLEDANLVVAIYSEDGLRQLLSGTKRVSVGTDTATVVLEGEMPEYFMASAYLLDTYDYSPLCAAYSTPMYTRSMQELLASTVDDYDADRVLNLDEDTTTNFAVYADGTILIEQAEGVNTVASVDDEAMVYVIENADEQFTSLQEGDVFVYTYGEGQMLIAKVGGIQIDGTTVTITGAELEMAEVFSHMKLETTADNEDVQVQEGTASEGVTYLGKRMSEPASRDRVPVLSESYGLALEAGPSSISGTLNLGVVADFSYYIAWDEQWIKLKLECDITVSAKFEVDVLKPFKAELDALNVWLFGGAVVLGMHPGVEITAKINGTVKADISFQVGFDAHNTWSSFQFQSLCTKPVCTPSIEVEGSVSFAFTLSPELGIAGGAVAEAGITFKAGAEVKATVEIPLTTNSHASEKHACELCIGGEVNGFLSAEAEIKFLKSKHLKFTRELGKIDLPIGNFYLCSCDEFKFTFGECTHVSYRTVFQVLDAEGAAACDATVILDHYQETTNEYGALTLYLPDSSYAVTVKHGDIEKGFLVEVEEAKKVVLDLSGGIDSNKKNSFTTQGTTKNELYPYDPNVVAYGMCGTDISWILYQDGLFQLRGSGDMPSSVPWSEYRDRIQYVKIDDRITSLASDAFYNCQNLVSVQLPAQLPTYAFDGCSNVTSIRYTKGTTGIMPGYNNVENGRLEIACRNSLKTVVIDEGVTVIGDNAFYAYTNGTSWCAEVLESVSLPSTLKKIGYQAFYGCSSLTDITLPDGLEVLGDSCFSGCSSLEDIGSPSALTTLGTSCFSGCTSLKAFEISENVTTIPGSCFSNCSSLTEIVIPDSVTSLADYAFYNCTGLKSVTLPAQLPTYAFDGCSNVTSIRYTKGTTGIMPGYNNVENGRLEIACRESLKTVVIDEGVTAIGYNAFYAYTNGASSRAEVLESVSLPSTLKKIGYQAFYGCSSLASLKFSGNAPTIGSYAFGGVTAEMYYPDSDETWAENVLQNYGGTLTWIAYTPEEPPVEETEPTTESTEPAAEETDPVEAEPTPVENSETNAVTSSTESTVSSNKKQSVTVPPETVVGETEATQSTGNGAEITTEDETQDTPTFYDVFDGVYDETVFETYVYKTVTFTGLVAGQEYAVLVLTSLDAEDPLAADNLQYITQCTADADGVLTMQYVLPEDAQTPYAVACGASNKDMKDAVITFPTMCPNGQLQVVEPVVVYDGTTLTEGVDYTVVGTVDYTEAGTYTCYIRGIYDYTGLVECEYTVAAQESVPELQKMIMGARMELGNALAMQFAISVPSGMDMTGGYIKMVMNSEDGQIEQIVAYEDLATSGTVKMVAFTGIAAKRMSDEISVTIYNADGQVVSQPYSNSIRNYVVSNIDTNAQFTGNSEMQTLAVDMLNYGAAAQIYFKHNEENLANALLTDAQKAYATGEVSATDHRVQGANYMGTRLELADSILLQFAFNKAVGNDGYAIYTFTNHRGVETSIRIEGSEFDGDGVYIISVDTLSLADINQIVTCTVYDANGNEVGSTADSVGSYIARMYDSSPLYEPILKFGVAAYAYFHDEV